MAATRTAGTADRILDAAERLVQVRGFNAFSYADVSDAVGIRKASLHHHFATKTDLGVALVVRYRRAFGEALEAIEAEVGPCPERLRRYVDLYRRVLRRRRMCLCGMLAGDIATLPVPMQAEVGRFFTENERWLARVLGAGKRRREVSFPGPAAGQAAFIVTALEGAMLVARVRGRPGYFDDVSNVLLAGLRPD
jgi:TetR/AcrR family transcriptional repressor of nem operon